MNKLKHNNLDSISNILINYYKFKLIEEYEVPYTIDYDIDHSDEYSDDY